MDFRDFAVTPTSGLVARYYCVRTTTNGYWLRQLCEPGVNGDGLAPFTGAVRARMSE